VEGDKFWKSKKNITWCWALIGLNGLPAESIRYWRTVGSPVAALTCEPEARGVAM